MKIKQLSNYNESNKLETWMNDAQVQRCDQNARFGRNEENFLKLIFLKF
jgi:hypothetical protein